MMSLKYSFAILLSFIFVSCFQGPKWEKAFDSDFPPIQSYIALNDDNLRFIVDSSMCLEMRNEAINATKEYIKEGLKIIGESDLKDSVDVFFLQSRDDMNAVFGFSFGGFFQHADGQHVMKHNLVAVVGGNNSVIKHEVMHMVTGLKWQYISGEMEWLTEGFSIFMSPETETCGKDITLEELYACLLQNDKLMPWNKVFETEEMPDSKISHIQSGYVVEYLYNNFGIEKMKQLWFGDMSEFEAIYGISFDRLLERLNQDLLQKYTDSIDIDWELFNRKCL